MDTRAEIEKLTARFAKAVTDKDFATLGSYYEERARFLPPGAPMVEGRAAIQAAQQKMIEGGCRLLISRPSMSSRPVTSSSKSGAPP